MSTISVKYSYIVFLMVLLIYIIQCVYGLSYLITESQDRYSYIVCWIFILVAIVWIDYMRTGRLSYNEKNINIKIKYMWVLFLVLYLKRFLLISISSSHSAGSLGLFSLNFSNIIPHLALLGIIIFPVMFFKGKGIFKYLVFIDFIYSSLLIVDLWHFRASGYFLDISYIFFKDLFNSFNNNLINPSTLELLFIISILILIYLIIKRKIEIEI